MNKKTFKLSELARVAEATLEGNPEAIISGVANLEEATADDISFLANKRYLEKMSLSKAGAIIIDPTIPRSQKCNLLISENPTLAFQKVIDFFYKETTQEITGFKGVHPTAVIHPTAILGQGISVGPYAVIDKDVCIGNNTTIFAGCYIGLGCTIGNDCLFYPHVILREGCKIGDRVILQAGSVIGSCGFGYTQNKQGHHLKFQHLGNVIIDNDVEIGANSTVDRARFKATWIKEGTKIDNLVQIAHNVIIGKHNIIVGQTGVAGSSVTGDYVMLGGQVAVKDHVKIGPKSLIAARSGVSKDLPSGIYGGSPAVPLHENNRNGVLLRNIHKYIAQIQKLEQRVKKLENG